jgi:hypothetical protein
MSFFARNIKAQTATPVLSQQQSRPQTTVVSPTVVEKKQEVLPEQTQVSSKQTKVFKLTDAKIALAKQNHRYIKTDGSGDLSLAGAINYWKKNPAVIYVPAYHVAGSQEDVRNLIQSYDPSANILLAMRDSYTINNFETPAVKAKFTAELTSAKSSRETEKTQVKEDAISFASLDDIVEKIKNKNFTVVETTSNRLMNGSVIQETKLVSRKKKGSKRNQTFAERHADTPEGFVLDVSLLRANGTGSKTVRAFTALSKKKVFPGYKLASNTVEGMAHALNLLGRPEDVPRFTELLVTV